MAAESRNRVLIGLAGALAVVKFVLLPWIDSQNDARVALEVLTRRLERSVGVMQNRTAIIEAERAQKEAKEKNFSRFPEFDGLDPMKLNAQVHIGEMAKARNLRSGLFEWILVGEEKGARLQFARARMQVSGELQKLAMFHGELEAAFPNMFVREYKMESVPVKDFLEYGGNLTLVADFYIRGKETP